MTPTEHVRLYEQGLRKRKGRLYDEAAIAEVTEGVGELIARLPMDRTMRDAPTTECPS